MTDAGFFRGTSADQDNRFANKQKKLLKELNFSPILNTKLNMSKIDIESLKPWIEEKIKDVLEKDDELLSESIYEHLAEKEPDGKNILVLITGFVDENKASKFMEELWTKLIDLQDSSNGVSKSANDNPSSELKSNDLQGDDMTTKSDKLKESNNNSNDDHQNQDSQDGHQSQGSSKSVTPPSRSVSKSPGGSHRLDERSRGRPRKRLQDEASRDGSNPPNPEGEKSKSRSRSNSRSRSGSVSQASQAKAEGSKRKSRSSSGSKRSGTRSRSRSGSRSRSRSHSGSKSRSSSRSPRNRSSSPYGQPYRGRRSRSRSHSRSRGYRQRSRSRTPRGRRGGYGIRGSYRGGFGGNFNDRRRGGPMGGGGPRGRRTSPWGRQRRFSPRSPPRRRRTPSFSPPRRRRTPSPYSRRSRSRSRSPRGHMMGRNLSPLPPRLHNMPGGGPRMDMMGGRHVPHHDMHRPMLPISRSPRRPIDHRGYAGDGPMLPRPDLPPVSHSGGLLASHPGPSSSKVYSSPPSSKKKHKKEKKHRKHKEHKKSKKHKKHKSSKSKKHKS